MRAATASTGAPETEAYGGCDPYAAEDAATASAGAPEFEAYGGCDPYAAEDAATASTGAPEFEGRLGCRFNEALSVAVPEFEGRPGRLGPGPGQGVVVSEFEGRPGRLGPGPGQGVVVSEFEGRLGYRFSDPRLAEMALTHRSWSAEHPGSPSNERLEFLGDAVLGLVVAQRLYERYGDWAEGALAKTRASLVNAETLAEVGRSLGLGPALRLGRGEDASGGRRKVSLLADAVESVIGAVYLDGGIDAAAGVIERLLRSRLDDAARAPGHADFKTRLQELAASLGLDPPVYRVTTSGPAHLRVFRAEVRAGGLEGAGEGRSKKHAEQRAAAVAHAALASSSVASESGRRSPAVAHAAHAAVAPEGGS